MQGAAEGHLHHALVRQLSQPRPFWDTLTQVSSPRHATLELCANGRTIMQMMHARYGWKNGPIV